MAVLNSLFTKLVKLAKRRSDRDDVRPPTREENISKALGKVEPYVVWLQSILIWENPVHTLVAYFCFNVLFWLVVSLDLRFYFLFFSTTLVVLIYEMWVDKVWPEIRVPQPAELGDNEGWTPLHPGVLSAPELSHYLSKMMQFSHNQYLRLQNLRNNQPGHFCALVSIGCLLLMWIGRTISGTMLLYIIFMSLLLLPGLCIHVLPSASQLDWHISSQNGESKDHESDVDEYLPEQSGSNLVLLQRAVEPDQSDHEDDEDFNIPPTELLHIDDMTDSGAPSLTFISGITAMPAHEDLSLDGNDFSLEISLGNKDISLVDHTKKQTQNSSPLDVDQISSDSDESISLPGSDSAGIHFQTRHFKRDSSSEEEIQTPIKIEENMQSPPRKSSSGAVADAAAAVLSYSSAGAMNLASVGQSLISSVISSAAPKKSECSTTVKEVDEDDSLSDTDDFEMISEEEFANL
ncbi:Reticulophagy regulator 3 [Frankliniella fusca]|uniref:Reticulophagy regulator 3 n=1 Tax=Frankliniella fusca TaxID=407009 RepID=A0AAE1GUW7_9NEOP|nr:Reticulophagy regulator 3 [Frankliniella fusca]